jgi:hypothetical protein
VAGIGDFDGVVCAESRGELKVEVVGDPDVALFERGVEDAAFEADGADRNGVVAGFDGELGGGGQVKFAFVVDEVPLLYRGGVRAFGGDESEFKEVGGENGELGVAGLGEGEGVFEG